MDNFSSSQTTIQPVCGSIKQSMELILSSGVSLLTAKYCRLRNPTHCKPNQSIHTSLWRQQNNKYFWPQSYILTPKHYWLSVGGGLNSIGLSEGLIRTPDPTIWRYKAYVECQVNICTAAVAGLPGPWLWHRHVCKALVSCIEISEWLGWARIA